MPTDTNIEQLVINKLSKEQYNEANIAGQIDPNQLYFVPNEDTLASNVHYDNKTSKLKANDVQGAIDEVNTKVNTDKSSVDDEIAVIKQKDTEQDAKIAKQSNKIAATETKNIEQDEAISNQSAQIALKADTKYVNDNFANAFVGNVSGDVIAVDDVSPIEHRVGCRLILNLADPSAWTHTGIINDEGTIETLPNRAFSNLIKASPRMSINTNASSPDFDRVYPNRILEYDENKRFIGRFDPPGVESKVNYTPSFGVAYIVVDLLDGSGEEINLETVRRSVQVNAEFLPVPYTPYIPDLSAVMMSRYGKNLLDLTKAKDQWPNSGITIDNDRVTQNASSTGLYGVLFDDPKLLSTLMVGETYCFSVEDVLVGTTLDRPQYWVITYSDGSPNLSIYAKSYSLKIKSSIKSIQLRYGSSYTGGAVTFVKPMISLVKGEWEQYKEPITYTPAPDGTVSGMTSLSPSMTILSDNPGVTISAEYNKDSNKVVGNLQAQIEELKKAVIATGGNV